MTDEKGRHMG